MLLYILENTIRLLLLTLSCNSEANASELLDNIEEIFALYYMHAHKSSMLQKFTTQLCVIVCLKELKYIVNVFFCLFTSVNFG